MSQSDHSDELFDAFMEGTISWSDLLAEPDSVSIVELTYDQRCALRWAIEQQLVVNDPASIPQDWDQEQVGILLRQARAILREVDTDA